MRVSAFSIFLKWWSRTSQLVREVGEIVEERRFSLFIFRSGGRDLVLSPMHRDDHDGKSDGGSGEDEGG
jgi:hypothetical protein